MAWYKDWFGRDEYTLVYQERDEEEAERVIDLMEQAVAPAPGAEILDVGCGRGRHARALARRGYRVTGIDLSETVIEHARELAAAEGLAICFRRGDMREVADLGRFDGVVNLFTAFGYFEDEAEHGRAVAAMAAALRPGGWLFQDFLNAPQVLGGLVPEDVSLAHGIEIRQRRWIADGRINKEILLHDPARWPAGPHGPFRESVRLLTLADFRRLYAAAGLALVATFGDYDGRPYAAEAPRLILHARHAR